MTKNTELHRAADNINNSTTGAIASVMADHVSVQVPGLQSMPHGKPVRFYSTEVIRSMRAAVRLVSSME